ncbi:MAG TPA: hypothetical protein VLH35_04265 [Candidatus Acidoferrales bacterium]|nr:hypothetical protein [Candidatus Acidoferrales bacterium]
MDSKGAEIKAREYIEKKYARLERVFFSNMYKEGNVWVLKGEVEFKRAYFFTQMRTIEVQVNMNTSEIYSYKEEKRSP